MNDTTHTYMRRSQAEALCKRPQRAKVEGHDAWGKRHAWVIEWIPETCDADAAMGTVGKVGVIWSDWCPVHTHTDSMGGVEMVASPVAGAATWSCVHQPVEVESAEDMVPGTWRIVRRANP